MILWLTIVGVALVTFGLRASFIVFVDPHRFPGWFRRALAYVPPSVLAAIVMPGLFMPEGAFDFSPRNPRLLAGLVAIVATFRLRSMMATIAGGMLTLWAAQWVLARLA